MSSRMEPKESREGSYGRARNVTRITSSQIKTLPMLVKILQTLPMLNKHRRGQGSTPRKCPLTPGWRAPTTTTNAKKKSSNHTLWAKSTQLLFKLKFISRNRPLINWGGMRQTGTLSHPLYILCNPNLVTPVNIRYKPCFKSQYFNCGSGIKM